MSRPPIGEPRLYDGAQVPVIYPGEVATARIDPAAIAAARARGETEVAVQHWIVEPMPGWHGWWRRTRYRVWGRWFATGVPRLSIDITPAQGRR